MTGAVKGYRQSELAASDLLDQLFTIFERNIDHVGTVAKAVAELMDTDAKRTDLLEAWTDFRFEVRCA